MRIAVLGLNHKSASVAVRERLAFGNDEIITVLEHFRKTNPRIEFALLSTCNRVELYIAGTKEEAFETEVLARQLAESRHVPFEEISPYLYVRFDAEAVTHLLTVSSSLDSMVVGESQIIAQVKECYAAACAAKSTGKILNRLFHHAFSTSKEIYSSTTITNRRVSVAGVAVDLAGQLFQDMANAKVLVIGAGEMGGLLVKHFRHVGASQVIVVNRSYQRAIHLAEEYGASAASWDQMESLVLESDIVVASAAVQGPLFGKENFKPILKSRRKGALLVIDIAVPRNFESAVNDLEGVYLYSVDDLAEVAQQNVHLREEEVDRAIEIICDKVAEFMEWLDTMQLGPLVGQLRSAFSQIRQNEMERFFVGPRAEASCRETMEAMVGRVVNRLLHCVIANLATVAREQGPEQAAKLAEDIVRQTEQIREGSQKS
ncbi:MAG: glutamyl-tRNA reductase [Sedimentisphaerales bacterium]|nr:glutamyl-tRNA reductase [Sedimentisphaerales bacterium]